MRKVVLVDVDCVVLLECAVYHGSKALDCLFVVIIFLGFLSESLHVALLGRINILGPAAFHVTHAAVLSH